MADKRSSERWSKNLSSKGRICREVSNTSWRNTQDDDPEESSDNSAELAARSEATEELTSKIRASVIAAARTLTLLERESMDGLAEDDNDPEEGPSQRAKPKVQPKYCKAPPFDITYARRVELRSIFDLYVEKNMVELNLHTFYHSRDAFPALQGHGNGATRGSQFTWAPLPWPRELQQLVEEATRHIQSDTALLGHMPESQAQNFLGSSPLDLWRVQTAIMTQMLDKKIPVGVGVFADVGSAPAIVPELGPARLPDYAVENLPSREILEDNVISCRVCFEQLEVGSNNRYLHGDMNHIFCKDCTKKTLEHRFECPVCRALILL